MRFENRLRPHKVKSTLRRRYTLKPMSDTVLYRIRKGSPVVRFNPSHTKPVGMNIPESNGVIFCQTPASETTHAVNHSIVWNGRLDGDEFHPSGGGWNTGSYLSIPDESTLIVRRNGTGPNSLKRILERRNGPSTAIHRNI